jgi:hypothetical protein
MKNSLLLALASLLLSVAASLLIANITTSNGPIYGNTLQRHPVFIASCGKSALEVTNRTGHLEGSYRCDKVWRNLLQRPGQRSTSGSSKRGLPNS